MSAVLGSIVFCCSALFSFCLVRDNRSRQCVVKEVSAPSFLMLFVQLHDKWGWWKSSPRKKAFFSQKFLFGLYYKTKVKDRRELGSCHWKVLVKPLLLISVVKGDSILHYASPKCKCYCKMRYVVFSLSLFGVHEWQYFVGTGRGLGVKIWLQTTFTFYTCQETKWKDSAWNKL